MDTIEHWLNDHDPLIVSEIPLMRWHEERLERDTKDLLEDRLVRDCEQ